MKKILFLLIIIGSVKQSLSQSRKVLLEEFTGAHCGQCPMGSYYVDSMCGKYPDLIAVAIHGYQPPDGMHVPDTDSLFTSYSAGAPLAAIDRIYWGGSWTYVAQMQGAWDTCIQKRFLMPPDITLGIAPLIWTSSTRNIAAQVNIGILSNLPSGDYRISLYITEDSVTGSGSGYDQVNFYNTSAGNPFFGMGNPIVGYVHKHVARTILPASSWGLSGIIPTNPFAGQNFNYTFTYTLPSNYNENKIHLIAVVYRFTANHQGDEVLNAAEEKLLPLPNGINCSVENNGLFQIYPNPASGIFSIKNSDLTIETMQITTVMGDVVRKIEKGNSSLEINLSGEPRGIYFLKAADEKGNFVVRKIVLQ